MVSSSIVVVGLVVLCLAGVQSKAVNDVDPIEYLTKFNYLNAGIAIDFEGPAPITEQHVSQALVKFQEMFDLKVTGEMNEETLEAMRVPRCGEMDVQDAVNMPNSPYVTLGSKWPKNALTYRLNVKSTHFTAGQAKFFIKKAFSYWAKVTPLTFKKVETGGDIIIGFYKGAHGDGAAFDGPYGVLAHALGPADGGATHFDDAEHWLLRGGARGKINFLQVATHEFGHALGLNHSKARKSVMRPYYRYMTNFHLSYDDIKGIQSVYGKK